VQRGAVTVARRTELARHARLLAEPTAMNVHGRRHRRPRTSAERGGGRLLLQRPGDRGVELAGEGAADGAPGDDGDEVPLSEPPEGT